MKKLLAILFVCILPIISSGQVYTYQYTNANPWFLTLKIQADAAITSTCFGATSVTNDTAIEIHFSNVLEAGAEKPALDSLISAWSNIPPKNAIELIYEETITNRMQRIRDLVPAFSWGTNIAATGGAKFEVGDSEAIELWMDDNIKTNALTTSQNNRLGRHSSVIYRVWRFLSTIRDDKGTIMLNYQNTFGVAQ